MPAVLRLPLALLAAAVFLSACAAPRPAAAPGTPGAPAATAYPAYESFDAAAYPAPPPPAAVPEAHDVPAEVMTGRVRVPGQTGSLRTEPVPVAVEGHRVQVFASPDRAAAERVRTDAVAWWETAQRRAGAPREMEAAVVYAAPTYRVRLGGFADDAEADAALAFVRTRFPDAFLVPDLITVFRQP